MKKRIAHSRMPAPNAGSLPDFTSGRALNSAAARRRPVSTARTTCDISKPGLDVQLRGEAHLDVADALGLAVHGELVGRALERLRVLQHRDGVLEAPQVLPQVGVALAEHQLFEPLRRLRGECHASLPGQLDQGREPQRAVEVHVEIGLGQAADQVEVHDGDYGTARTDP